MVEKKWTALNDVYEYNTNLKNYQPLVSGGNLLNMFDVATFCRM